MLKTSKITSAEIEKKLEGIEYSGGHKAIDKKVENSNIPYFSIAFFYFVFQNDTIPSEEELLRTYIKINNIEENLDFLIIASKKYSVDGVKNRMLRSYPSLIRDFHFFKLCQESRRFDAVKYSTRKDIFEGIDLLIVYKGLEFCIAIYTQTKRALKFKKKKNEKRHDYVACDMQIALPINLSGTNKKIKKISNFILLSSGYILELEEKMNSYAISNQ